MILSPTEMPSHSSSNTQGQVKDNNAVIVLSPDASNKAIVRLFGVEKACSVHYGRMRCKLALFSLPLPSTPPALCPSVTYFSIVCSVMDLNLCERITCRLRSGI